MEGLQLAFRDNAEKGRTTPDYGYNKPERITEAVILCIISATALIGNTSLWIIILRSKRLKTCSNYLILCLSSKLSFYLTFTHRFNLYPSQRPLPSLPKLSRHNVTVISSFPACWMKNFFCVQFTTSSYRIWSLNCVLLVPDFCYILNIPYDAWNSCLSRQKSSLNLFLKTQLRQLKKSWLMHDVLSCYKNVVCSCAVDWSASWNLPVFHDKRCFNSHHASRCRFE